MINENCHSKYRNKLKKEDTRKDKLVYKISQLLDVSKPKHLKF